MCVWLMEIENCGLHPGPAQYDPEFRCCNLNTRTINEEHLFEH